MNYSCSGKLYNNEKAIISLTSWKARINTVSKTLFSLVKMCPGFHIVLVLSEEEFPQKENELPEDLMLFVNNNLIELLWVYKNYKAFKKVLFTMDKYKDVPVISADDDCIYICNYADKLYQKWLGNKDCIVTWVKYVKYDVVFGGGGHGILYPPNCFKNGIKLLNNKILESNHDDAYYGVLAKLNNITYDYICLEKDINTNVSFKNIFPINYNKSYSNKIIPTLFDEIKKNIHQNKKYTILMYNFNNYEVLREPIEIDPEAEYIYVTDNKNLKSNIWKIIYDAELDNKSVFDKCYSVRFNLFKYASTPICIYLDGSIQINKSLRKLYADFINSDADLGLNIHHNRKTVEEDYLQWIKVCNYSEKFAKNNMEYMKNNGYDIKYKGLYQGCLRICKNTEINKKIDEKVYSELWNLNKNGIIERQDQVVYSYVLNNFFENKVKVFPIATNYLCSEYITWCKHGKYEAKQTENRIFNNEGYVFNQLVNLYNGK